MATEDLWSKKPPSKFGWYWCSDGEEKWIRCLAEWELAEIREGKLSRRTGCKWCPYPLPIPEELRELTGLDQRIDKALAILMNVFDGDHHKMWTIDQAVRVLTGDGYANWVKKARAGEDGPDTYEWDTGIAP